MAANRLRALGSPEAAHRAARAILAEGRFHQPPVPDPLHGVLEWVGHAITNPFGSIGDLITRLGKDFPGGVAGVWALGAVILLIAVGLLAMRRARTQLGVALELAGGASHRETPAELERQAARAERGERWDEAVRLRFRAGILRLGERLELTTTDTIPNHMIARRLQSRRFDSLAERFDEVAYGGGTATAEDAEQQRKEWPELLSEAGRP